MRSSSRTARVDDGRRACCGRSRRSARSAPTGSCYGAARRRRRPRGAADPGRARGDGDRGRRGDDAPAVPRRRLPPLHRARVPRRGRGGRPERPSEGGPCTPGSWSVRQARNLMREPIWIVLLLIQPMIWLLLYGQLFKRVDAPSGRRLRDDLIHRVPRAGDRDHERLLRRHVGRDGDDQRPRPRRDRPRFLATPVAASRSSLSQVVRSALTAMIQAIIILVVGARARRARARRRARAGSSCSLAAILDEQRLRRDLARASRCSRAARRR